MESDSGFEVAAFAVPVVGLFWIETLMSVSGAAFWGLLGLGIAIMIPVGAYFNRLAESDGTLSSETVE